MAKKVQKLNPQSEGFNELFTENIESTIKAIIETGIVLRSGTIKVLSGNPDQYFENYIENLGDIILEGKLEESEERSERIRLAKERIQRLKDITFKIKSPEYLSSLENPSVGYTNIFEKSSNIDKQNIFEEKLKSLTKTIEKLSFDVGKLKEENLMLKNSFIDSVSNSAYKELPTIQFLPVEIYIDTHDAEAIIDAYSYTKKALEEIGLEANIELPAKLGSWYKKLIAKTKDVMTSEEITSRLKELEYGVEVNGVLKQQSEIDKNQSEALLNILKGIEKTPNAVIRIGSLLVVKVTSSITNVPSIQVRTLAIKELYFLNKNPHLTSSPVDLLTALANNIDDTQSDRLN